ncbi:MAG: hypothetical protein M3433_03835 [Actinomycetota bacterium]|nr:hypothetical protein [Actinomycetota bacterium]
MDSRHADAALRAAYRLGVLLEKQGEVAGASAAYERALESGEPRFRRAATFCLGSLRAEQGDAADARAAFERGLIECGCGDAAPPGGARTRPPTPAPLPAPGPPPHRLSAAPTRRTDIAELNGLQSRGPGSDAPGRRSIAPPRGM